MSADSSVRRFAKSVLHRTLGETGYSWIQAITMARDIRTGRWSEPELDLVRLAVRQGETVVDGGANYGLWTWHLSRAVGPAGAVLAYEPVPFTVGTLRRVVRLLRLRNVRVRPVALGDAVGRINVRVPVQHSGAISAGQAHFAGRVDERPGSEVHVRWDDHRDVTCDVVRLDDDLGDADVSFIKLDLEGAEAFALAGGEALLARCGPTLVVEVNPWFLEGFGQSVNSLVTPLLDAGYRMYALTAGVLQAVALDDVIEDNYVLVHHRRAERVASLLPS